MNLSRKPTSFEGPIRKLKRRVYILHAGEDKETIARPLWRKLRVEGIRSFLDKEDMQPGGQKEALLRDAMEEAVICVAIVSPELAAKKWTMIELEHFVTRYHLSNEQRIVILPVFYRLSVEDCSGFEYFARSDRNGRNLFLKWGFFERAARQETSVKLVRECMKELTRHIGIENSEGATNDDTDVMMGRREELLVRTAKAITALIEDMKERDSEVGEK